MKTNIDVVTEPGQPYELELDDGKIVAVTMDGERASTGDDLFEQLEWKEIAENMIDSLQTTLATNEALHNALTELVRLRDQKVRNIATNLRTKEEWWDNTAAEEDYKKHKPLAWEAAREALKR